MRDMWKEFNDYSLVMLALRYGIEEELEFDGDGRGLLNREHVERVLTKVEHEMAFGE